MCRGNTPDDLHFNRGRFTKLSTFGRARKPLSPQAAAVTAAACANEIEGLGKSVDEYEGIAGNALQVTLGEITKRFLRINERPDPEEIFELLQRMRAYMLSFATLSSKQVDELLQFARLMGSMQPTRCLQDIQNRQIPFEVTNKIQIQEQEAA